MFDKIWKYLSGYDNHIDIEHGDNRDAILLDKISELEKMYDETCFYCKDDVISLLDEKDLIQQEIEDNENETNVKRRFMEINNKIVSSLVKVLIHG